MRLLFLFAILNCLEASSQANYMPFATNKEFTDFLNFEGDSSAVFLDFSLADTIRDKTLAFNYGLVTEAHKKGNVIELNVAVDFNDNAKKFLSCFLVLSPDCYHYFSFYENPAFKPKTIAEINKSLATKPTELFLNFLITHDRSYLVEFLNMPMKEIGLSTDYPIHPDLLLYLAGAKFLKQDVNNKYQASKELNFSYKYINCRR